MTKYILQFSRANGGGEYLVLLDERPNSAELKEWVRPGVQFDAMYEADIETIMGAGALPTQSTLEVR